MNNIVEMNTNVDIVDELNSSLNSVMDFIEHAPKELKQLEEEMSNIDLELSDIYHYLECVKFNASEGYLLAKEMQIALIKRRQIKMKWSKLHTTYNKFSGMFLSKDKTKQLVNEVSKIHEKSYEKEFNPKIRVDLVSKIKKI